MPKFAANLTTMYKEYEIPDRFSAAAEDGFSAVEFLNPYGFPINEVQNWLSVNNLQLILINTHPGLTGEGTVGLAALPGREKDFRNLFEHSLAYAIELDVSMIHVLAGVVDDHDREAANNVFQTNIRWAAEQASANNINIMLEPLNTSDVPGYFYTSSQAVATQIEELEIPNIKLQYDFYHMQIMEGNLAQNLTRHLPHIGHVQFSSLPGRHEPQYGEVNVSHLFNHLDEIGYQGWVGCEYSAKGSTHEGLSWAKDYNLGDASK